MIHPAAAAGEDGDGPLMTVSVNNGLWRRRQWAWTVVFISDVVASAAVVGERRQQCWIVDGVAGERRVSKGDVSRLMAVAVEGGDGGGGGSYRDFTTIFLNLGATVLF